MVKPGYLSDEEWMKCCEWAKGGIEIAIFTGNDMQKLIGDKREERMFFVSLNCLYASVLL